MEDDIAKGSVQAVGQAALRQILSLKVPSPYVQSFVHSRAKRIRETPDSEARYYPPSFATGDSLRDNLRFALKHEPLDLGVFYAALKSFGPAALAEWVRAEPTSQYSRRAWFLYEHLSGERIDVPNALQGNYVNALDTEKHYTACPRNSPRHRVRDNLLGGTHLCPTLRRTPKLARHVESRLNRSIVELVDGYPKEALARAAHYLYTKETRSSFAIEGETPRPDREAKFTKALEEAAKFTPDTAALIQLQNSIVDERYAATELRDFQNFVGGTKADYQPRVDYVCPKPEDVPFLMQGWLRLTQQQFTDEGLDPVLAATLSAFAFVFIHPFEDGNGRLHRFLVHAVLAKRQFTPPGLLFPISAAILRQRPAYDQTLETFSRSIEPYLKWRFTSDMEITVENGTRDLYRFWDATPQAEFLYDCVADTVQEDFKDELDFLTVFDAAFTGLQQIVDMPDRRAHLLLRLIMQNGDRLSRKKRGDFAELTDAEIADIEQAVQKARQVVPPTLQVL